MIDKSIIEIALKVIAKTKELIFYSVQLTDAVQRGAIRPEHFESKLIVPEPHSKNGFHIDLDWTKFPEVFSLTANDAQVHIASYAIIICKESYPKSLWVEESLDADLYSAQMILKLIRDALGHMCANSHQAAMATWDINKKNRRIFEIKKLDIFLDARQLHDQQFKFSHLGGLSNLLLILDYLATDLKSKL